MTAKELIEAAKKIGPVERGWTEESDIAFALAQHILETVRPDDDEPVTRERLEAEPGWKLQHEDDKTVLFFNEASKVNVAFSSVGGVRADDVMWIGGFVQAKSMGHLRRLVAALGE